MKNKSAFLFVMMAVAVFAVTAGELRQPVPLSDPRFNGTFEWSGFTITFDGTSRAVSEAFAPIGEHRSHPRTGERQDELEIDVLDGWIRRRPWRDFRLQSPWQPPLPEMPWYEWGPYRFSENDQILEIWTTRRSGSSWETWRRVEGNN